MCHRKFKCHQIARLAVSKRILVLGSSGSGKTTLSKHLARILNINLIHLDACFWKPGWTSTPQSEWRATVASLIQEESWIMDGTYESTLDLRIPAAESVIMVERSRLSCLWRVLKRKATIGDARRPDAPPGQRLDRAFLGYIWHYPTVTRPFVFDCLHQYGRDKALIELRGSPDIERCVHEVQRCVERSGENR